jgi:hypothetical protein
MAGKTPLSEHDIENAIVQRLFRASLEIHSALSIVRDERTAILLRQAIDRLDRSIRQVQHGAADRPLRSRPQRGRSPVAGPRLPRAGAVRWVADAVTGLG